jgi:hypothetical protein
MICCIFNKSDIFTFDQVNFPVSSRTAMEECEKTKEWK